MAEQWGRLSGDVGSWSMPVAVRGALRIFADSRVSMEELRRMDPQLRFDLYGVVPIRTVQSFEPATHEAAGWSESLVGAEVVRAPTAVVLRPDAVLMAYKATQVEAKHTEVSGSPIPFDLGGTIYPAKMTSASKFNTARASDRAAGGRWVAGRKWIFADGRRASVTPAQVQAIYLAAEEHIDLCFANLNSHLDALEGKTGQAILDHDISTGWPAVYSA